MWSIISAPLYLSFDLRDTERMENVWPVITNQEIINVSQLYAGHPGRLIRQWTPADQRNDHEIYVVTADLNSCQVGWSFMNETGQVVLDQGRCVTLQQPDTFLCGMVGPVGWHQPSFRDGRYCDDTNIMLRSCDANNPKQKFTFSGDAHKGTPGLLTSTLTGEPLHLRAQPWYEGAGVHLTDVDPRQLRFVAAKNGNILQTAGSNLASDVCLGGSETSNIGEALMLWAKPQPNDAIAVLLVNNHPHRSFQNVTSH